MSTVYIPQTTRPYRREELPELEPAFPPGMPGLTSYIGRSSAATVAAEGDRAADITPEHRAKIVAKRLATQRAKRNAERFHQVDPGADQEQLFCLCGCGSALPTPTMKGSNRPVPRYVHGHNRRDPNAKPSGRPRGIRASRLLRMTPEALEQHRRRNREAARARRNEAAGIAGLAPAQQLERLAAFNACRLPFDARVSA